MNRVKISEEDREAYTEAVVKVMELEEMFYGIPRVPDDEKSEFTSKLIVASKIRDKIAELVIFCPKPIRTLVFDDDFHAFYQEVQRILDEGQVRAFPVSGLHNNHPNVDVRGYSEGDLVRLRGSNKIFIKQYGKWVEL